MLSRLFPSVPNRDNNAKVVEMLDTRAQRLPPPMDLVFRSFSASAYCVVEEIVNRDRKMPRLFVEKVGVLSSEQFSRLYRAIIWSFTSLYTFDVEEDGARLLPRTCEVFVGRLNEDPSFECDINLVIDSDGIEYLSLRLHQRCRAILGFSQTVDPGVIPFAALFAGAYGTALETIRDVGRKA